MKTQLNRKIILGSMLCLLSLPAFAQTKLERLQAEKALLATKEELLYGEIEKFPYAKCYKSFSAKINPDKTLYQTCGQAPQAYNDLHAIYVDILQKGYDKRLEIFMEQLDETARTKEALKMLNSNPDL